MSSNLTTPTIFIVQILKVVLPMRKIFIASIISLLAFAQVALAAQLPVNYQAYVEGDGWLAKVTNGETAGTTGQGRRMEAVIINLMNGSESGVKYCAHVQNIGWQGWKNSGEVAGTFGQNLRMEAVRIQLDGRYSERYDIYYRAHVQNGGWLGWAKNGEPAGTAGLKLRMEALQIQILRKGSKFERGAPAFFQGDIEDNASVV